MFSTYKKKRRQTTINAGSPDGPARQLEQMEATREKTDVAVWALKLSFLFRSPTNLVVWNLSENPSCPQLVCDSNSTLTACSTALSLTDATDGGTSTLSGKDKQQVEA